MELGNVADESTIRFAEAVARGNVSDDRADESLFVEFSVEPVLDMDATDKEQRPVYRDVDYIRICRPGDKNDVVHRPVWFDRRHRYSDSYRCGGKWARAYEDWKKGNAAVASGTPLAVLADMGILSRSDVAAFQHAHVRTAEQFVGMADVDSQRYPGFSLLKAKVQAYLERSKEAADAHKLESALKERDVKLAAQDEALKAQGDAMREMAAQLASLQKAAQARKQ